MEIETSQMPSYKSKIRIVITYTHLILGLSSVFLARSPTVFTYALLAFGFPLYDSLVLVGYLIASPDSPDLPELIGFTIIAVTWIANSYFVGSVLTWTVCAAMKRYYPGKEIIKEDGSGERPP